MNGNKELKRLIRERIQRTGESYSTARMHVLRRHREIPAPNEQGRSTHPRFSLATSYDSVFGQMIRNAGAINLGIKEMLAPQSELGKTMRALDAGIQAMIGPADAINMGIKAMLAPQSELGQAMRALNAGVQAMIGPANAINMGIKAMLGPQSELGQAMRALDAGVGQAVKQISAPMNSIVEAMRQSTSVASSASRLTRDADAIGRMARRRKG